MEVGEGFRNIDRRGTYKLVLRDSHNSRLPGCELLQMPFSPPFSESPAIPSESTYREWRVALTIGRGPLGSETAVAIATKGPVVISATASLPQAAVEMVHDMIDKRED